MSNSTNKFTLSHLETLYLKYNYKKFVHPDPLEFLYNYENLEDKEIVAVIASSLAYGRVKQILKSVSIVLKIIELPSYYVKSTSKSKIKNQFKGFRHRFTSGDEMSQLLFGIGRVIEKYGSLKNCFVKGLNPDDKNVMPAMQFFTNELTSFSNNNHTSLIPNPQKGSACKRLNLMLRWLVRRDNVDPGGWNLDKSKLIIPLDTHMHAIAINYGLTKRRNADIITATEITEKFANFFPSDPVRYDFALTRPSIGGH